MRRLWVVTVMVLLGGGVAVVVLAQARDPEPDARPEHVILVDWDGFDPEYLGRVPMPNFDALARRGSVSLAQSTFLLPQAVAAVSGAGYVPEVVGPGASPAPETEVVIVPNAVRSATVALRGRAQSDEGRTAVRGALASLGPALVRIFDPGDLMSMHAGTKLGDFVVEARPPYGFAVSLPFAGRSRAAHGSTGELTVPLLVSGPGFRAGRALRDPRLVDVAPTIASLLGVPPPAQAQGRVLSRT